MKRNYRSTPSIVIVICSLLSCSTPPPPTSPYPSSTVIEKITWHEQTHISAAPGSDLWPVTWGTDNKIYTAWGDGGGFEGTNRGGRVSLGFASIEGEPTNYKTQNLNGGVQSKFPPTWKCKDCGKTAGILAVDGILYTLINLQNDEWPNVDMTLAWSNDFAATWKFAKWKYPAGEGNFKPGTFINYGRGYEGGGEYIYFYGMKQNFKTKVYLGRASKQNIKDKRYHEYFAGLDENSNPQWTQAITEMKPVFIDPNGTNSGHVVFNPVLKRYLRIGTREKGGEVGVFDAPNPWGPWTTIAYYDNWLTAGGGYGLTYSFANKWTSADGLTMWMVFSVYDGAEKYHDRFNLIKTELVLK